MSVHRPPKRDLVVPVRPDRFGAGLRVGLGLSAVLLAAAPAAARIVRSWSYRSAITGDSMAPSLAPGDWVLVDPLAFHRRTPRVGDLVVVPDPREPERWLVKRVVDVGDDGRLSIEGDNAERSTDSRTFGPVDPAAVVGRPWARYWPPSRWGRLR